jgi:hypothetical protein
MANSTTEDRARSRVGATRRYVVILSVVLLVIGLGGAAIVGINLRAREADEAEWRALVAQLESGAKQPRGANWVAAMERLEWRQSESIAHAIRTNDDPGLRFGLLRIISESPLLAAKYESDVVKGMDGLSGIPLFQSVKCLSKLGRDMKEPSVRALLRAMEDRRVAADYALGSIAVVLERARGRDILPSWYEWDPSWEESESDSSHR